MHGKHEKYNIAVQRLGVQQWIVCRPGRGKRCEQRVDVFIAAPGRYAVTTASSFIL